MDGLAELKVRLAMNAQQEGIGADDGEWEDRNELTTAFEPSNSSEGLGMQVCVQGDENGGLEHDDE